MGKITKETLRHVAANSRLKLNENEIKQFEPELKEVLEAFEKLREVDVKSEIPQFQPIPSQNIWREDKETECLSQDDALANTKHKEKGYFKGPKVVE